LGLNTQSLMKGDVVMLHQNYVGTGDISKGDMGVVLEVGLHTETVKDLTFIDVKIEFEGIIISTKVLVNCLLSERGEVNSEAIKALKSDRMAKNTIYRSSEKASDDPYMSAMHLRYGYAITCHKAQGSEWKKVLIEPKFHLGDQPWLYTAVTRASETVYSWWY
jgi:exodeoxyribonuclease V